MSERSARRYEETLNKGNEDANINQLPPPPPEPIYDRTADDETKLIKAGTPRERREEP